MVWVRALAGVITLCFQARYVTLTMPLSTQVYKWVPANLMLGGSHKMDPNNPSGGGRVGRVEILLVASCYIETGISSA